MDYRFPSLSRLKRQVRYLAGYLDFAPPSPVRRSADFDAAARPVLLLPGFLASRRAVQVLERRLQRDGYTVFSFDMGGAGQILRRGVDDLADFVRGKVERLYGRHPGMGPLTIVGHSQGGLIGAWYVKKLGGWRRVRALVTLGTPHQGTPAAWAGLPLALLAPALWQMTPGSTFVRRLHGGAWPPGVRLTSIWSRRDRLAPWPAAMVESSGLEYVRNVEVAAEGHRDFLHRKHVYEVLVRELRDGDQAAPVRLSGLVAVRATRAAVRAERQGQEALQAG